jgi:CheY-like chemotaxis protein
MSEAIILLVDDDKTILDSLKQQLRHVFGQRFRYETAEDVPEAWEVLGELEADAAQVVLIVSDWLMPGIRGDEFLVQVRARHPHIARVMLTGQADADALQRARDEAEVMRVIHKPWSLDDLREVIEAASVD